ncbi:MAG: ChbG/HpnK family deacetylase [Clostridiales bacterium]|jgi:hypothetical protein|nr:ChbG/HpnK family deacetylase [Clostridiales bacterium]
MKDIRFVTRADDAGSSVSANLAIAKVLKAGFIKNCSVMAPGAFVDEAAKLLTGIKGVCFGMHFTLNAEWDRVKWGPVSPEAAKSWMVDENSYFLANPRQFPENPPNLELIEKELNAQLERLHKAGFKISYVDTHMMPEIRVKGMDDIVRDFAIAKGLIDHMYFYEFPKGLFEAAKENKVAKVLKATPEGQYFFVTHPALYTEEMLKTGNSEFSGEEIAKGRSGEAKLFSFPLIKPFMKAWFQIRPLRYDEATPLSKRLTPADAQTMLGVEDK